MEEQVIQPITLSNWHNISFRVNPFDLMRQNKDQLHVH